MRIIQGGTVVSFFCPSCDCMFVAGIHEVESDDGNYYCKCPLCGRECHTDVNGVKKEEQK